MLNKKSLQKKESNERILNVASRLFKTQGYAATGIDEIMAEAGLTAGGFYSHFKSKTDLLEQTLIHSMNHSRDLLTRGLDHLKGDKRIEAVMARYVSAGHRDFPEKGCILPALAAETYRGSKKANVIVAQYLESWAKMIEANLPIDLRENEKKEKALEIISQAVGAVLLSRMVKGTTLSDQFLRKKRG